jgi:hypothetical protein
MGPSDTHFRQQLLPSAPALRLYPSPEWFSQGFHDSRADSPAQALGYVILYRPENDGLTDKLWPGE